MGDLLIICDGGRVYGREFELTQNDIEELSSIYFAKPKNKGDISGGSLLLCSKQNLLEI